ncbi:undecaprenyldiphospho-muramoylpentapeptide beta-N-acetylglucosaminyltransferase [Oenococcus alcoholitolerans]|uniref:undecaprenyldiphospho-muramoylpentapeptide beta-N-acetylglucosaminyltransferase n=1 Tax=Oenococcus alcoholitolerans TaxID=931074 RepID=UPI003F7269AF
MRIIVSGGGTGGHIYPGLALIDSLLKHEPDSQILYVGSFRGLEGSIVPKTGIEFKQLAVQGFSRSLSLNNFKTISMFLKAVRASKKIIAEFKPDIVLGTGGYVSGAVLYAAQRLKIPTVINEQNSIAGMTNKFLSRGADKIAISFPHAAGQFPKSKVVMTGNPRGQQVVESSKAATFSLTELKLDPKKPTALIFGGSGGALRINQAVIGFAHRFSKNKDLQVIFVSGKKYYPSVKKEFDKLGRLDNVRLLPYLDNMDQVLPRISLLVCRSGATTLAEITSLGIPSILIPSPNVTANHQEKNARQLETVGACEVITEDQLSAAKLYHDMTEILSDESKLNQMGQAAKKLGHPDAADRLYALLVEVIDERKKSDKK